MNDKMKNEMFFVACDYLFREKLVTSQKDLAQKIGISESALSRLKNGTKGISDETLRKMNEAFGHIFNMAYFRGRSTKLLIEDATYYDQHPEEDNLRNFDKMLQRNQEHDTPIAAENDEIPYSPIPAWANTLIEIMSQQIKQNEALNRKLHQTIENVKSLQNDLQNTLQKLSQNHQK